MLELNDALAGRYVIEREIGRGGMATVFLAREEKHGRMVAIKILRPELAMALGPERFLREIQIAARLTHPHLLPLYDSGDAAGKLYYVMPYIEGESLRSRLRREPQFPVEDAIRLACEVAGALDYAHRHHIVHRDIKPENILLEDGHAIVADFGIAHAVSAAGGGKLTETGLLIGTPAYMSPEQADGTREVDGRTDLYSLACVLYEMLIGEPPFTGPTAQAVMARHALEPVRRLTTVRGSVPDDVEEAILRSLAKVPADRFATVGKFAEALRACSGAIPWRTPHSNPRITPAAYLPVDTRGHGRRVAGLALGALLTLAVVGAAWGIWLRGGGRDAAAGSRSPLDARRVAVLYFRDLSPRHELTYLADGLTETLIQELQDAGLDVVSKNGAQMARVADISADSAARTLKAGTLIEGSIEPVGDQLRIVVALTDGATGARVASREFDHPAADPLGARDSLVRDVAEFLRPRLGEEVRSRELAVGTRNAGAWALARQAEKNIREAEHDVLVGDTSGATRRLRLADSLLSQSESRDRAWVEPLIMRGTVAYRRSRISALPPEMARYIDDGLEAAGRALALDPRNAAALELRGTLRYWRWINHLTPDAREAAALLRLAEEDLRAAVRSAPSRASAWYVLSNLAANKDDPVEAAIDARRAYEEDAYLETAPEILWQLYGTYYDNEQFADAAHWCSEGHRRFPSNPRFVQCRLWLLTMPGSKPDIGDAWRLVGALQKLTPETQWTFESREAPILVAAALARAGLADSARHVLERSRGNPEIDPERELVVDEMIVREILGDRDETLRLLKTYLVSNPEHGKLLAGTQSWWWRSLKTDPRFRDLVGGG